MLHHAEVLLLALVEQSHRAACARHDGVLVLGDQFPMSRMYWTVSEAADLLAEAYLVDLSGRSFTPPDPITLEALARALDAHPEVLEQVWNA